MAENKNQQRSMNRKFSFILVVIVCLFTSCSSLSKSESESVREEIVFNDGYNGNEVVIEDKDLNGKEGTTPVPVKGNEEITKIEEDNSRISVVTDRYGNRIETRTFNQDPQLALIVLQTSADGKKQVFVYGQNGDVKSVPENMLNKIMTAPANEIASAAGISVTRRESFPTFAQNQTPSTEAPLK